MSCLRVDTDKHGIVALMTLLQGGSKLERMGWYHTIVVIRCCYQCSRIGCAWLQVVQGRVAAQILEHLFRVLAGAIVTGPVPADGELVIAQHVHHTHFRDGNAKQFRTLCHAGSHKQSAIRTAYDSQLILAGITLTDQPFCSTDEIVEHVLLLHLRACQMPFLTILTTASQRHLCIDAAILEERNTGGRETRTQ